MPGKNDLESDLTALAGAVADGVWNPENISFQCQGLSFPVGPLKDPFLSTLGAQVPTTTAQAVRLGKDESDPTWKKNCSRQTWALIRKKGLAWDVKPSVFDYVTADGDHMPITYIKPSDYIRFLMTHHPSVMVGGLQSETDRALHLESFWEGFRLANSDHMIYSEHNDSLSQCLPVLWHGDEGRGKRRGNTVVVSLELPMSVATVLNTRKRCRNEMSCCDPPAASKRKYANVQRKLSSRHKDALRMQVTTMKGHSLYHRFPLFIIPSGIHHAHPDALIQLLGIMASDLRQLFFEGLDAAGKHYTVALVGAKGDLKWHKKIALERSWDNQGIVRNIACCHQCGAGADGIAFEDMSENPVWAATRWASRPWTTAPVMNPVPFCSAAPEKQYSRDVFHLTKVGIYRDLAGSALCFLVAKGYFGQQGDFDEKLANAHGAFTLFCRTTGLTPALRTFSRSLMMYPRFSAYPWANVKGSDCMLLLKFLAVQCCGFENAPLDPSHLPMLRLIRATCKAATGVIAALNKHNLWVERDCSMSVHGEMTKFVNGYMMLASSCLNDVFNGFGIKPKLHLFKHEALEWHEALLRGDELLLNWNIFGCEGSEDCIGRVCRLSRRLDSRRIGERVLGCCLVRSAMLHRRFIQTGRL